MIGTALLLLALAGGPSPDQLAEHADRLLAAGDADRAISSYEAAIRGAEDGCPRCYAGIAAAHLLRARYYEAMRSARKAIELGAPQEEANLLIARALLKRPGDPVRPKRIAEAEELLRPLVEAGDDEAAFWMAHALTRREADDEARAVLDRALAEPPQAAALRRALEDLRARPWCGRSSCLPQFEFETLSGARIDNASLAGRVVVFDFWATWCAPCVDALPHLKSLRERFADEPLVVVGVSVDEDRGLLEGAVERHGIDWEQIWDRRGTMSRERFGVQQYPTYLVVGADGVVRARLSGWGPSHAGELDTLVSRALREARRNEGD